MSEGIANPNHSGGLGIFNKPSEALTSVPDRSNYVAQLKLTASYTMMDAVRRLLLEDLELKYHSHYIIIIMR